MSIQPVEVLAKGVAGEIEVGTMENLVAALGAVKDAVVDGELDAQIASWHTRT